jgi:hypothetical protein
MGRTGVSLDQLCRQALRTGRALAARSTWPQEWSVVLGYLGQAGQDVAQRRGRVRTIAAKAEMIRRLGLLDAADVQGATAHATHFFTTAECLARAFYEGDHLDLELDNGMLVHAQDEAVQDLLAAGARVALEHPCGDTEAVIAEFADLLRDLDDAEHLLPDATAAHAFLDLQRGGDLGLGELLARAFPGLRETVRVTIPVPRAVFEALERDTGFPGDAQVAHLALRALREFRGPPPVKDLRRRRP